MPLLIPTTPTAATMNVFRLAGDGTHLLSFVVLLLKILATRSCRGKRRGGGSGDAKAAAATRPIHDPPPPSAPAGISLRTQELYTLVFVCRYLDLFTRCGREGGGVEGRDTGGGVGARAHHPDPLPLAATSRSTTRS